MDFNPAIQTCLDGPLTDPFRDRVNKLRKHGVSDKTIAAEAGISTKHLYNSVQYHDKNISTRAASRLAAAVEKLKSGSGPLPAGTDPARPHIAALQALGYRVILVPRPTPTAAPPTSST